MYTNDFKEYECQNGMDTLGNIMDTDTFYLCCVFVHRLGIKLISLFYHCIAFEITKCQFSELQGIIPKVALRWPTQKVNKSFPT